MAEKFYITTAITYTSQKPHIGNTYEVILTDAIARFKRLIGCDVFFLTGTDEHGQKIEDCAKAAGMTPQKYVDGITGQIKEIWNLMNSSYDKFIRTTDDYHMKAVQHIFKKLYEQGDIYKGEYNGKYCVPCEAFFTETQLVNGCCPDCGRPVKQAKEEAYFFKMSKYQDKLLKYIEENPEFIQPEARKREMVNNFLKPGLQDLCVSRSSFKWGIPVSFDDRHVIYVWIDALSNYITALGYDPDLKEQPELFKKYWPANIHVIGKDILRFHTIYWPIMLMALGVPLPKQVFGHPWMLFGQDKMSKSRGNVMYADDLVKLFGVDAVRYYVLSEMPFAQDGSITYETIIARYNSDLANTLGNLVNRSVAMVNKYFGGVIKPCGTLNETDNDLIKTAYDTVLKVEGLMNELRVSDALEQVINLAKRSNKYIDETAPWVLAKDEENSERLATVLYNLLESIRFIAVLLSSFMPQTADKILKQINCPVNSYQSLKSFGAIKAGDKVGEPVPLFTRIDEAKMLADIAASHENHEEPKKDTEKAEGVATIISIEDFAKVELRVAKITACEPVPKANKLLKLQLDDGMGGRQVVSGIAQWYKPEDLTGKKVIVVANLKPANLRGVESQGMILAADAGENNVKVIFVDDSVPCGSKVR